MSRSRVVQFSLSEAGLISAGRCREAAVALAPDQSAFAGSPLDQVAAFWDEVSGWSLIVHRADVEAECWEGTKVLPDPDAVAAWVAVGLIHPGLEPAGNRVCFRDNDVADPAFDTELASYSTIP